VWAFNEAALGLYKELGYEVRSLSLGKVLPQNVA
jgi:ribosomal protein S18 acetylase RimI-like enzyme